VWLTGEVIKNSSGRPQKETAKARSEALGNVSAVEVKSSSNGGGGKNSILGRLALLADRKGNR